MHPELTFPLSLVLSSLGEAKRRASEHHSTPQRSSKHSGMPPKPYPPHSDPQTLVPVAEYNYLGEVVVFSERWWGADPQRAIADPRQLQTTQVTPPLMPQHMFASDMLFAEMQLPVGSCIFRIPARRSFCSVIRCAQTAPNVCHCLSSPPPCCWHRLQSLQGREQAQSGRAFSRGAIRALDCAFAAGLRSSRKRII